MYTDPICSIMEKISINNNGANKCIRVRISNTQLSDKNNIVYEVKEKNIIFYFFTKATTRL